MSLLFKPEHVQPILDGRKTQTRRLWPKGRRVTPGSLQWAQTGMFDRGRFARLLISRVWQEKLGDISDADAREELCANRDEYLALFERINGPTDPDTMIWAIEFEVRERVTP